jgi:uncharacterized protein YjeT (DUF2065 family)
MWDDLLAATALFLVFEGIMPFISPRSFRESLIQIIGFSDRTLRMIGLASMVAGVIFLYIVRH